MTPAFVPAVAAGVQRPLWSVMIPSHECGRFLPETIAGVLAQDPGPDVMEIEVVDDASVRDDLAEVVNRCGLGRVRYFRQPANVGHIRNFQTCLERARGHYVHLLHGDDVVRPGFYARLAIGLAQPGVGAAFCRHEHIDAAGQLLYTSPLERPAPGVLEDWLPQIAVRQRLQTPSIAVRREVYERLGGFAPTLRWVEDWEMWTRIAAHYAVWFEPQVLAAYRRHGASSTARHEQSAEDARDRRRAIDLIAAHLPAASAAGLHRQACAASALWSIEVSARLACAGDRAAAWRQLREALRTSTAPRVLVAAARALVRLLRPRASAA